MRAYVIEEPGGADRLQPREVPVPEPEPGWVLIRITAFGLNRSEWFTRRGDSPSVRFPRILGIECCGVVERAPDSDLAAGTRVAALMGGMGRAFDGSYAEYTCVPREHVFELRTSLPSSRLAALPEMLQTTHGSLHVGLELERADSLLIRGGTSSIGLAALALAKALGKRVATTTRNPARQDALLAAGADHVFVDGGELAQEVRAHFGGQGAERVLELVGTTTLRDSLAATRPRGIVCMTGILGGSWSLERFTPMDDIPTGVKLTSYSGGSTDITQAELQRYVDLVERGELELQVGPVLPFERLRDAHRLMDQSNAGGKIVILVRDDET
ncbi:MAG: zinc-binding dehydrogenase [Myxococcales bacterium]|nr:zinc-binding dehydrogenase [Myxococcales bacterium]